MIAINTKGAFQNPRTGLEEYVYQIIRHLLAEASGRGLLNDFYLYAPSWNRVPQEFAQVSLKVIKASHLWTQGRLALQLLFDSPDIFFNPEQVLPYGAPKRSVITVHDLAYEIYPRCYPSWRRYYLRKVTRRAVKKAKKIIAVSERTKRDITKFYGIPQRKIEVIYHGYSRKPPSPNGESLKNISLLLNHQKNPYFLFVGRIEQKKNIIGLVKAFEQFISQSKKDIDLLLVGPPGFGFSDITGRIELSPQKSRIKLLGYVDEQQKEAFYTHALLFVSLSSYEGFGLPALEAQNYGTPVIASSNSSLPEVVGKGGILVDPEDPGEIAEAMRQLTENKKLQAYCIKQGYENLERFSWQKTAAQTLNLLLSL